MVVMRDIYTTRTRSQIIFDSFWGGMAWGIGSILGAVLLFAIVGFIITRVQAIPIIGNFVYNVLIEVEKLRGN